MRLESKYFIYIILSIIVFGVPLIPMPMYLLHVIVMIYFYAFLATSWNIISGYSGALSLGHAVFLGISAYATYFLFTLYGITPWIGLIMGGLIGAGLGAGLGYPTFRFGVKGVYFALVTIAFAEIFHDLILYLRDFTGGALGLYLKYIGNAPLLFQFDDKRIYCYMAISLWLLSIFLVEYLKTFRIKLVAIREDEIAAACIGINPTRYKLMAIVLSGFLTALGGTFWLQYYRYISPSTVLGLDLSVEIALIGIFGGVDSVFGPTVGAIILKPISEFLRAYLGGTYSGAHLLFYSILLMIVLIYAPEGVIGFLKKHVIKRYRTAR